MPRLRFKDFEKIDFRCGALKEFGYFYYGKSAPKHSVHKDAQTPCVRYGELYSVYHERIKKIRSFTDIAPKNLKFSKGGEVLIPRVGEDPLDFAHCSFLPIPNIAIGEMISVYNTKEDGLFMTYYINAVLKKDFARVVEGANVSNLYFRYLEEIEICIPQLQEQRKIANFLELIGEWIENLRAQKESFEAYKKGIMQKIFSQEIRFKDDKGNNFPKWEEKKLGDIFKNTRGHVLAMPEVVKEKTEAYQYPVYSSQTKNNGLSGYYKDFLFRDCITWTTDGANAGDVKYRPGKFYCTNVCGVLESSDGYANPCVAEIFNQIAKKYVSYVGNPKLMNNVVSTIKIFIPGSIGEQQKIADFLTSIDNIIESKQQQIAQAEQWKKGLMQQLFV